MLWGAEGGVVGAWLIWLKGEAQSTGNFFYLLVFLYSQHITVSCVMDTQYLSEEGKKEVGWKGVPYFDINMH